MSNPEHTAQPEIDKLNQPFHDLLHTFAQDILRYAQASLNTMGMAAYPLDTQREYERKIDDLLADRDMQRGGQ